jgi:hypothetical protein
MEHFLVQHKAQATSRVVDATNRNQTKKCAHPELRRFLQTEGLLTRTLPAQRQFSR